MKRTPARLRRIKHSRAREESRTQFFGEPERTRSDADAISRAKENPHAIVGPMEELAARIVKADKKFVVFFHGKRYNAPMAKLEEWESI